MIEVNCIGLKCPLPLIATKKALVAHPGEPLQIIVDNDTSCSNLKTYLKDNGISFQLSEKDGLHIIITGSGTLNELPKEVDPYCSTPNNSGYIVVFDSNEMGKGNSDLGKILIKGFLTALSENEELPNEVICYNGGVLLADKSNEASAYLQKLEQKDVKITLCGTCVDFYGIKTNLAVGTISNMFYILGKLASKDKIIKP